MKDNQTIWLGKDDLTGKKDLLEQSKQEFYELPVLNELSTEEEDSQLGTSNRRDFLKYLGFGVGAAAIAASCETPVRRAIPYVNKPDAIVPGVANFYASSFVNGKDFVPILVKTREGRPIKIEGNPQSPLTHGGTSARAQAMVLELYDSTRVKHAGKINDDTTVDQMDWEALDATIQNALSAGSNIRILTPSNYSPSFAEALKTFKAKYPNTEVVTYDAHSNSAMLLANQNQFGTKGIPSYHFDKAEVIVNFNADFLGTWIAPVQFAHQWAKNRKIKDAHHAHMSRMIAFESHMTLTGSNADSRVVIRPSELGLSIAKVHNEVAKAMGGT